MKIIKVDLRGINNIFNMSKGYFLTTIINQSLPFFLLPVLTRYLSTAEYGLLSLFSFFLSLSNALVGASMPKVISKCFYDKGCDYVAKMIGNCIFTASFLTINVLILILICYILGLQHSEISLLWLMTMPLTSLAYVIFNIGLTVCRNDHKVFHFSCHQIGNTVINVLVSLLLVCIMIMGWKGRVIGIEIAFCFSALLMLLYLRRRNFLKFSFERDKQSEIWRVILPLIPNSVQLVMISQVGIFFMQMYFDNNQLGLYALGFQISYCLKLLVDTLLMSWSPFFYQQLAHRESLNKLYVSRLIIVLALIISIAALIIVLMTKPVLFLVTTPDYYNAQQFVPWMTMGFVFYGLQCLVGPVLIKGEQQKYIAFTTFISMIVMLLSNVLFAHWFGYMGIAYAFFITYGIMSAMLIVRSQKVLPMPWIQAVKIF